MTKDDMIILAIQTAEKHGIDAPLFCSLCHHESGNWNPWAVRYEPAFFDKYIASLPAISVTEGRGRAFSYGLCQIMGQTARELGFAGDYLTQLIDPATNLEFGARKLKRCLDRANGDVKSALLLYNGGGDKTYPDKVLRYYPRYKSA